MLYAATLPRMSRTSGNARGSKPVNTSTSDPAPRRSATAASNASASASGSARGGTGARPQQVVAARRDADQVWRHGHGQRHLLGGDLPHQLAANREVRVAQPAGLAGGQPLGEPVGPAAPAPGAVTQALVAGPVGIWIPEAFGKTVTQRDEGADFRHRVPH